MYKYTTIIVSLILLTTTGIDAQSVGIGTSTPETSAALEIKNANKGLLIPRVHLVSAIDNTTIPAPAVSLLVYNTNASLTTGTGFYFNNGTTTVPAWEKFVSSADDNIAFAARSVVLTEIHPDSIQLMPLTSEDFDVSNNFTLSNSFINPSTFIAPVKGIYHFEVSVSWIGTSTPTVVLTKLRVNGLTRIDFIESQEQMTPSRISSNVMLNAGDKVNIYLSHQNAYVRTIFSSFFSGNLLFRLLA